MYDAYIVRFMLVRTVYYYNVEKTKLEDTENR